MLTLMIGTVLLLALAFGAVCFFCGNIGMMVQWVHSHISSTDKTDA